MKSSITKFKATDDALKIKDKSLMVPVMNCW
jgi:hypothetical protein